jgi:hypothetical protein
MTEEVKRTFPFVSGDKVRLPSWPADAYVEVWAYGDYRFFGKNSETGEEEVYFKNGQMAYGEDWEAHSPTPATEVWWAVYNYNGKLEHFYPVEPRNHQHGYACWQVQVTPTERIYP